MSLLTAEIIIICSYAKFNILIATATLDINNQSREKNEFQGKAEVTKNPE